MIDPGKISEEEKTPLVTELLHAVQTLREDVQRLRDEIARLKQHKGKPKIPPSRLEKDQKEKKDKKKDANGKRPGSEKRSKTKDLTIHETVLVPPKDIPPGSTHVGHNGYCTHIGNELFAWFESTGSKSRINFLQLLRNGHSDYVINEDALSYIQRQSFPQPLLARLAEDADKHLATETDWKQHLAQRGIKKDRHVRIATEGALLGSVLHHGFSKEVVILSDDAGQFNIFRHALCWIHAERTIHKLIGCSDEESKAIEAIRDRIWLFYRDLKAYKEMPDETTKLDLEARFDEIFATETCSAVLDAALRRVAKNKEELLLVLDRPDIPLHNNLSESDIREYVKKRKISGSTRSDNGRQCRDTFTSLKKTCRKLGVSFWGYLNDRVSNAGEIPPLPDLIRARARSA